MLGQATASLEPGLAQLLRRTWGIAEIHTRQKWSAIWPFLSQLPDSEMRILDAGCGMGRWTLELAIRHPSWFVMGVDRDPEAIARAQELLRRSGIHNAQFQQADFLKFNPPQSFDLILSVASAHYLVASGMGRELFGKFSEWLAPGGELVLYGPRAKDERPETKGLDSLGDTWGFRATDLHGLTQSAGMHVDSLLPQVRKMGTLAKQIAISTGGSRFGRLATYPLQLLLSSLDRSGSGNHQQRSAAWLLIASK